MFAPASSVRCRPAVLWLIVATAVALGMAVALPSPASAQDVSQLTIWVEEPTPGYGPGPGDYVSLDLDYHFEFADGSVTPPVKYAQAYSFDVAVGSAIDLRPLTTSLVAWHHAQCDDLSATPLQVDPSTLRVTGTMPDQDVVCDFTAAERSYMALTTDAPADPTQSFTYVVDTADANDRTFDGQFTQQHGDTTVFMATHGWLQTLPADGWFSAVECSAREFNFYFRDPGPGQGDIAFDQDSWVSGVSPQSGSFAECTYSHSRLLIPTDTTLVIPVTCLGGNGRVDINIVNTGSMAAVYRIQFGQLSARQLEVDAGRWWRMPVTGRWDGDHRVLITRDGETIHDSDVTVACDIVEPMLSGDEVTVISSCVNGRGFIGFQFVNRSAQSKPYVIRFDTVPNRSTTAGAWGQAVRGTSGRPNGSYTWNISSADIPLASGSVVVDC